MTPVRPKRAGDFSFNQRVKFCAARGYSALITARYFVLRPFPFFSISEFDLDGSNADVGQFLSDIPL